MRQCEQCGKGSKMVGARRLLRGHYNPVNWTRKYPNLQWAKVDGARKHICATCMKSANKAPHKVTKTAIAK